MKHLLTLILVVCATTLFGQKTNATVKAVHDGDSFKVQFDDSLKKTIWVRLWGVDCPEVQSPHVTATQDYGVAAGDSMRILLKGQRVFVDTLYRDAYNRPVAKIKFKGRDITEYVISTGKGWYYSSKAMSTKNRNKLQKLQSEAQTAKLGLWAKDNPIKPSEFRRKNKGK